MSFFWETLDATPSFWTLGLLSGLDRFLLFCVVVLLISDNKSLSQADSTFS